VELVFSAHFFAVAFLSGARSAARGAPGAAGVGAGRGNGGAGGDCCSKLGGEWTEPPDQPWVRFSLPHGRAR